MSTPNPVREYDVAARSADVFGRVLCQARNHHFVIDGPVQNGCPGEALTPPEAFLTSVAACGVELVQVIGRENGIEPLTVRAAIHGRLDRSQPVREDYTVFNEVTLDVWIGGTTLDRAQELVAAFQRRCPLYGSVAVATPAVKVRVRLEGAD